MTDFFQDPPRLGNQYDDDRPLRDHLARVVPAEVLSDFEPDLQRFGQRVTDDIRAYGDDAEENKPKLVSFDPWGRRIDRIDVAHGWKQLERISAEEGLVAIAYERRQGAWSRLYQAVKLYLFNPSSAVYTCPLAMTDGAARVLEVLGDDALQRGALRRLTTRDPERFWTSGQWMTERAGGSDVGRTGTIARSEGDAYRLFGTKWFTSATTSQMAMTLARIEDATGQVTEGSRGLSLFYLETRDDADRLNGITIHRLKDKLGTRAVPTAELTLEGTRAQLVGEAGRGVRNIATLINITRLHNAISSVAVMRRGLLLARDYATRREAFGKKLADQPLHVETLAQLEVECSAAVHMVLHLSQLLGKEECGEASADEVAVARLLTPLAKLYTAKQSVAVTSEILESFGGAGYVEDTGLPRMLRDTQVTPIWEGTTNILSLDTLRAIERDGAFEPFLADVTRRIERVKADELRDSVASVARAAERIQQFLPSALAEGLDFVQAAARSFAFSLSRTYMAALLLEQADWSLRTNQDRRDAVVAKRWCRGDLTPLIEPHDDERAEARALALDQPLAVEQELAVAARH